MARIFCFLLFVWLVSADQEEVEGGKCERIKLPLCQDLGYNWTAMPNLMGHKDQKEAENAVRETFHLKLLTTLQNYYRELSKGNDYINTNEVSVNVEHKHIFS